MKIVILVLTCVLLANCQKKSDATTPAGAPTPNFTTDSLSNTDDLNVEGQMSKEDFTKTLIKWRPKSCFNQKLTDLPSEFRVGDVILREETRDDVFKAVIRQVITQVSDREFTMSMRAESSELKIAEGRFINKYSTEEQYKSCRLSYQNSIERWKCDEFKPRMSASFKREQRNRRAGTCEMISPAGNETSSFFFGKYKMANGEIRDAVVLKKNRSSKFRTTEVSGSCSSNEPATTSIYIFVKGLASESPAETACYNPYHNQVIEFRDLGDGKRSVFSLKTLQAPTLQTTY